LLILEPPLQVLPTLAVAIGLNEALFLQQLHYWLRMSPHVFDGRRWVYNDYKDWHAQFPFWSERTLRRVINRLERPFSGCDRPLIITTTQFNRHAMDQTKWYTADYDALDELSAQMETTVSSTDHTLPDSPPDFTVSQGMSRPCGHVGHMGGPDDPAPIGQHGYMICPEWPAPIGQHGNMVCPEWPAPTGQVGHLSLQRLPETTHRETHTPCARLREGQEGEGAQLPETPETQASPAPPTDPHATPCGEVQTSGDHAPEPRRNCDHPVSSDPVTRPVTAGLTGTMSPPGDPEPTSSAAELVQYFYRVFHHIEDGIPTAKALSQAERLIAHHGVEQAMHLIDFSHQEAAQTHYKPETLGGILQYQPRAFAAFDAETTRQQQHQTIQSCNVCDPNGWVVFERLDSGESFSARCPHDEDAIRRYEATQDCQRI